MREPRIKFEGFEEAWEQCKLGDVVQITMGNPLMEAHIQIYQAYIMPM